MTLPEIQFTEERKGSAEDKWGIGNTWSNDQKTIELQGKIDQSEVSFTLTETNLETEKVSTKSFEGTFDEARFTMNGKLKQDEDP